MNLIVLFYNDNWLITMTGNQFVRCWQYATKTRNANSSLYRFILIVDLSSFALRAKARHNILHFSGNFDQTHGFTRQQYLLKFDETIRFEKVGNFVQYLNYWVFSWITEKNVLEKLSAFICA